MKIEKQEYVEEQGTVLEPDLYEAVLTGFGEMDGQYGPRLVWQFDVEHEGETIEAAAFTSYSMADKPRKSNLLKFSEALNGGDPEGMDLDDLLGKPCRVDIENYTKQNGIQKNKVADVKKPAKGQKGKTAEKTPADGGSGSAGAAATAESKGDVEFNEKDFDDIPLAHVNAKSRIAAEIL